MNTIPPKTKCVVCGSDQVRDFAEVLQVPVHSSLLWKTREAAVGAPRGDIALVCCSECGHIFNRTFDVRLTAYTQAYENSLHFSPLFQEYAEGLADRLIARHHLSGKKVIEIGCGQGDFLALLCNRGGCDGMGFDPSFAPGNDLFGLFSAGRLKVVPDFYTDRYRDQGADLVVCRQVLEHIPEPRQFLKGIRETVGDRRDTGLFFEVPNVLCPLRDGDIWTLIYEHCSFYSGQSLGRLFQLSGFDVLEVAPLYQDLFLGIDARPGRTTPGDMNDGARPVREVLEYVEKFAQTFQNKMTTWQERFAEMTRAGKKIVVWGGGARGVTFLNMLRESCPVRYVVDINPRKTGTYAPGTGQEFVLPEFLRTYRPDAIVVMNAVYEGEIRGTLNQLGLSASLLFA